MDTVLAVYDYEQSYVTKLTEYLNRKKALPFQAMGFNEEEKLCAFCSNNHIQTLLVGESMLSPIVKELPIDQIFLLNESERVTNLPYPSIYKFQSGEQIVKGILESYAAMEVELDFMKRNKKVEIIGVYSPIGRNLQTTFSLTLGQLLSRKKKCLYLNFEPFSGFSKLLQKQFEHDFMDLLYFLRNGTEKFIYKLNGMIAAIGDLDFVPPAFSFMDLIGIKGEEWHRLLQTIEEGTEYEIIILDLSDAMQGLSQILSICDRIYTIVKPDGVALAKIEQYEQILTCSDKEDILKKTVKCSLPNFTEIPVQVERLPYCAIAEYIKENLDEQL